MQGSKKTMKGGWKGACYEGLSFLRHVELLLDFTLSKVVVVTFSFCLKLIK